MKILITGSNGMLGHDLENVLKDKHELILTTSKTLDITDKDKTMEIIKENNPDIVINSVPEYLNEFNFGKMMMWYHDAMNLEFVKTKKEIELSGDNPKNYIR